MRQILAITQNTFRESVRSKVLYSMMIFAALVVLISGVFGSVTIGDQARVLKDFGLFALSVFSVSYVVLSGSLLLHKELARKTIYNILSKAVPRWQFLVGKFLGMYLTALVMLLLMALGLSVFLFLFEGVVDLKLFVAYLHLALELLVVCAAVIFFSAIVVTPMLIGLFSAGLFLAGRSASLMLYFVEDGEAPAVVTALAKLFSSLLPQFERFNVANEVVYDVAIPTSQTLYAIAYSIGYAGILLVLAHILFQRREFN